MRVRLVSLLAVATLVGCGGAETAAVEHHATTAPRASARLIPDRIVRSPDVKTSMDTNAENLASAVVTYSFGQLPKYIDDATFRLLPHAMEQISEPGATLRRRYELTVPRTQLVLDSIVTSGLTTVETRETAKSFDVDVALDGRHLRDPSRFWVFYRNNGAQICRIYFPNDLASLNMGVHSVVLRPLAAGRHLLRVTVRQRVTPELPPARFVADYRLDVLARGPNARERAIAPDEEGPKPSDRTPLTFRNPSSTAGATPQTGP